MAEFAGVKIKNEQASLTRSPQRVGKSEDISLAGMTVVVTLASFMGLWGLACLISGLVHSDGLLALGTSWLSAVFGF